MSIPELFIGCHIFGVRDFSIECHDRSKCVALRDQSELTRSEVMVLTLVSHFYFIN